MTTLRSKVVFFSPGWAVLDLSPILRVLDAKKKALLGVLKLKKMAVYEA